MALGFSGNYLLQAWEQTSQIALCSGPGGAEVSPNPLCAASKGEHVSADCPWGWRGEPHGCSTFLQVKCNFGCGSRAFEVLSSASSVLLQE